MPGRNPNLTQLGLPDSDIRYCPGFIPDRQADILFRELRSAVQWQQDPITLFGKTYMQPRLTAFLGEGGKTYSYSGITMKPAPFPPALSALRQKVEMLCDTHFNTCLLNLYRDGRDSNGWHSDDEKELGSNPPIASVSLGQARYFHLRHRKKKSPTHKIELGNGSLLLMLGPTQHFWQHQIPKSKCELGERINLTFRRIL
jgi:alkylated DNA repair dioxygenase AlkB